MWARVVEMMLGVWLALSPFIFRASDPTVLWADPLIALVVLLLAGVSYWERTRMAHLLLIPLALGLFLWGRLGGTPPPPEHQNHIALGLLLLMFAIIPNEAATPDEVWRESC